MGILEREKKYSMIFDIPILLCLGIQMSFYDWWATVVKWLLMHFSQDFLVLPSKRVIRVLSIRDNSILLITNKSHKAHLLSCA